MCHYLRVELRTAFILMDSDRDGRVTAVEIQAMLEQLGISLREDIVMDLVRQASQSGNYFNSCFVDCACAPSLFVDFSFDYQKQQASNKNRGDYFFFR